MPPIEQLDQILQTSGVQLSGTHRGVYIGSDRLITRLDLVLVRVGDHGDGWRRAAVIVIIIGETIRTHAVQIREPETEGRVD